MSYRPTIEELFESSGSISRFKQLAKKYCYTDFEINMMLYDPADNAE